MSEGYTKRSFDDEYGRHALTTTDNGLEETTVDVSWLLPGRYFHPTRLPDDYVGQHRKAVCACAMCQAAAFGEHPSGRGQATTQERKESR